jgi:hypothetical protein
METAHSFQTEWLYYLSEKAQQVHTLGDLQAVGDDIGLKFGTRCCHRSMFSLEIAVPLNLTDIPFSPARARFRRALFMTLAGMFLHSPHSLNFCVYCRRLQ